MATAEEMNKTPKSSVIIMPPEGSNGWNQIQAIREKHDKSYVRWMPHINMLYPFMADANEGRDFQDAAYKLTKALKDVKPFKVKFSRDSWGYFDHGKSKTLWLKPLSMDTFSETVPENAAQHEPQSQEVTVTNEDENETADGEWSTHNKPKRNKGKPQKKKFVNPNVQSHPAVMELQSALFREFPACDDLHKISAAGFNPHLSVGQFKQHNIDEFALKFQEEWEDFEFDVQEVFLISRADFNDPFHIRHCVRLGGSN